MHVLLLIFALGQFQAEIRDFSLFYRVQIGSGTHMTTNTMDTWYSFPEGKATGA
jgi:hypothetical protein